MLYNPNKKGTIILSHYRSGGTQLIQTLWLSIGEKNTTNLSEYKSHKSEFCDYLKTADKYSLILLNDSETITKLYQDGTINKLKDDYVIVALERKDKINCVLSMGLWERFIAEGYFKAGIKSWTDEVMLEFHNKCKENLLPANHVTIGRTNYPENLKRGHFLNYTMELFVQEIKQIRSIADEYNFFKLYYEDFEYDNEYLSTIISSIDVDWVLQKSKDMNRKIPYVSNNYLDYYVSEVADVINGWKLNEL